MHLTLTSPVAPHSTETHAVDIGAAGLTIGSDPHNDWIPDRDPRNLCAVQAAVRVENGVYTLVNLASRLPVTVNGSTLACLSSARLQPGDEITLGACRVTTQASVGQVPQVTPEAVAAPMAGAGAVAAPVAMAATVSVPEPLQAKDESFPALNVEPATTTETSTFDARPATTAETSTFDATPATPAETSTFDATPATTAEPSTLDATPATAADADPFADLLGPGTLPLGTAPTLDTTHPFDMASAAPRNAADPLAGWAQRPDDAHAARTRDPLDLFEADASREVPDVFTDHTPSVLDRDSRKRS